MTLMRTPSRRRGKHARPAFQVIDHGGGRLSFSGEFTFATVGDILARSAGFFEKGAKLLFDLEGVERTDSAGMALLVEWMRTAERTGARVRFIHLPDNLWAIARVSGVTEMLPADAPLHVL